MSLPKFTTRDIGNRVFPRACRTGIMKAKRAIRKLHGNDPFDAHDLLSKWKPGCGVSWGDLVKAVCCMLPQEVGQRIYDAKRRADIKRGRHFPGFRHFSVTRGSQLYAVYPYQDHFKRSLRRIISNAAKK